MMKILYLLCSLYFYVIFVDGQEFFEGDPCFTQTAQLGTCTKVSECFRVQCDLDYGITNHVVCGFDGSMQIVCCPNAEPPTTTSPPPSTTTSSPPPSSLKITLISDRVSVRKCNEYKEPQYQVFYTVGGIETRIGEFPHMALIGSENDRNTTHWACGGTLISEQFVLTAAHCFYSQEYGSPKYVRLGEHDRNLPGSSTRTDLRIIEVIPHPNYQYAVKYNDIGLLKLERRIDFSRFIRPACLPEQSSVPTKTAIATGWGKTKYGDSDGSSVLLEVELEMFTQDECNSSRLTDLFDRNLKRGIVEETQICAGSHTEKKDTCPGDSGGPLQIDHATHRSSYTIVGITSFGSFCAMIGTPSVYTRVYAYLDWIEQIVWPDE